MEHVPEQELVMEKEQDHELEQVPEQGLGQELEEEQVREQRPELKQPQEYQFLMAILVIALWWTK